ncbi:VOC family protein [Sinimarinibacterium thermocellulolyticum]|uniref:VOC family protein n=1 Tax=Sinimarinibacterium thermocellulolyticum TaxID=3170016 RepID=A0ABV2A7T7_9GAMM
MRTWYPIITTAALHECADFYQRAFDARVLFRSEWYLHLSVCGGEIGFLRPNPPTRLPVFLHTTQTRGLCLAIEVPDVRAVYEDLQRRQIPPLGTLSRYGDGELSFSVVDPAGTVLNVVARRDGRADLEPP